MKTLPLTGKHGQGKVVLLDDEWYDRLKDKKIWLDGDYAVTWVNLGSMRRKTKLHRLITDEQGKLFVDHINGDTLDNRIQNLRPATNQQNQWNAKLRVDSVTGFKGVAKKGKKYRAYIYVDNKQRSLGAYRTARDAAIAYNGAAIALFGEFARLNPV